MKLRKLLNEPDPISAFYPDLIVGCGSLPTAGEVDAPA